MSKGHGCMIQYVILEEQGVLWTRATSIPTASRTDGSARIRTTRRRASPLRPARSAMGSAWRSDRRTRKSSKQTDVQIFCLLSDGEFQEGSTWEAMMMAANLRLDNLIALMDNNDFSGLERMSEGHQAFYPLVDKAQAFGWEAIEVDGHDEAAMFEAALQRARREDRVLVVCRTVKGKGVSYMENVPIWHYRSPNNEEYTQALAELERRAMRNRFADTFYELGKTDPRLCIVVADISPAGTIAKFRERVSGPLRQHRRRRADHDRHGRRHGAARPAALSPTRSRPSRSIGRSKWCATTSATRICR